MCFTCFTLIMDFLLKQSLSEETESLSFFLIEYLVCTPSLLSRFV